MFIVFNRDALLAELTTGPKISKFKGNDAYTFDQNDEARFMSIEAWDSYMSSFSYNPSGLLGGRVTDLVNDSATPVYADEILPFNITITFSNEYGKKAMITLYGVELLNEGIGFSIDSTTTEKAYTFVCRAVDSMEPVDDDNPGKIYSTW